MCALQINLMTMFKQFWFFNFCLEGIVLRDIQIFHIRLKIYSKDTVCSFEKGLECAKSY